MSKKSRMLQSILGLSFIAIAQQGHGAQEAPQNALVTHLIVKLRSAPEGLLAPLGQPVGAGASLQSVIDRVRARRANVGRHTFYGMESVAPVEVHVKRAMSGGATVLGLEYGLSAADAAVLARDFAADDAVEYAEPDVRMQILRTPNDQRYEQQWGYFNAVAGANLPEAWDVTTGRPNMVVAVIDTGYRPHADLAANLLPGYDFISNIGMANDGGGRDADASDPGDWVSAREDSDPNSPGFRCGVHNSSWHGTHVAGTVGGLTNNGTGIAGVSWHGKVLPVRVLGKCGGMLSDIVDGMRWAAGLPVPGVPANKTPARVLNMSLGGGGRCSRSYQSAIDEVTAKGAVVVVAAGNENQSVANVQPANCNGVISVAATDIRGHRASFSNFGPSVSIAAPGVNILSTVNAGSQSPGNDGYASFNGTSMATPHVAGIVSLMLTVNPGLQPAQVLRKLQATARPFPVWSNCTTRLCGAGIVDAGKAVK